MGARLDHTRVEPHTGLCTKSRLLIVPTNIRPGWKWQEVANTLAYYDTATITVVKSFIVQALGENSGEKKWKMKDRKTVQIQIYICIVKSSGTVFTTLHNLVTYERAK